MKVSDAPPPAKGQPNDYPAPAPGTVALSPEQFARIEELLLPGYELAKFYLAQVKGEDLDQMKAQPDFSEVPEPAPDANPPAAGE